MSIVKNWDGREFTIDELKTIVEEASECELSVDEMVDGDMATSEHIIRGLIDIIESSKERVLMSRDNHDGWKLEEILDKIASELEEKNQYLVDTGREDMDTVIRNNTEIITQLRKCVVIWKDSMVYMEQNFGPNAGPSNPRV